MGQACGVGKGIAMDAWMVVDFTDAVVAVVATTYCMTKILPMKHPGLFWLAEVTIAVANNIVFDIVLHSVWPGLIVLTFTDFVLPCLVWQARPFQKICALFVLQLSVAITAVVLTLLFEPLFGVPEPELWADTLVVYQQHMGLWALYEVLAVIAVIAAFYLFLPLYRRLILRGSDSGRFDAFGALVLAQMILCFGFAILGLSRSLGPLLWGVLFLVCSLGMVMGLVAIAAQNRWTLAEESRRRAAALMARYEHYRKSYRKVFEEAASLARLRHDLRNELAVAEELVCRGRAEKGARLLNAVAERCAAAEGCDVLEPSDVLPTVDSSGAGSTAAPREGANAECRGGKGAVGAQVVLEEPVYE